MNPIQAFILSNKYTDESFDGYSQTIKGISPTVTVTKNGSVNDIDFKYVGSSGQEYHEHAYVNDGEIGPIGPVGETGPSGQNGQDGKDGIDGKDGFSPIATVEEESDGAKITITDSTGTTSAFVPSGGGGGGTSDYNELENLPTINGKEVKNEIAEDIAAIVEPLSNNDVTDIENIIDDDVNI